MKDTAFASRGGCMLASNIADLVSLHCGKAGGPPGVPVWNGLTINFTPRRSLCDLMTMLEHAPEPLAAELPSFACTGDARSNMGGR